MPGPNGGSTLPFWRNWRRWFWGRFWTRFGPFSPWVLGLPGAPWGHLWLSSALLSYSLDRAFVACAVSCNSLKPGDSLPRNAQEPQDPSWSRQRHCVTPMRKSSGRHTSHLFRKLGKVHLRMTLHLFFGFFCVPLEVVHTRSAHSESKHFSTCQKSPRAERGRYHGELPLARSGRTYLSLLFL